jgi:hypothetical protein
MRNRNLLDVVASYVACLKNQMDDPSNGSHKRTITAHRDLISTIDVVRLEDITEMFADLRDYWDTLEVGK